MMKVTYLGHSGFLVEMDDVIFLFDYYKGELPEMDPGKKLLVFVSHAHYDHYRKEIFSLRPIMVFAEIFVWKGKYAYSFYRFPSRCVGEADGRGGRFFIAPHAA